MKFGNSGGFCFSSGETSLFQAYSLHTIWAELIFLGFGCPIVLKKFCLNGSYLG